MKTAVSSYSFCQYIKDGRMTQLDTVKKAAEMGFSGIEFAGVAPCDNPTIADKLEYAKLLKNEADKYNIDIVAYSIGANLYCKEEESDEIVKKMCAEVDVASALGAPIMRHDVTYRTEFDGEVVSFDRQLPMIVQNVRRITEYAALRGIKTCSENHGIVAQDSDRLERLYNAVGHKNYGVLVDIGNFACADENSAVAVSRLAPYAIHVHAKDFLIKKFGDPNITSDGIVTRGCNVIYPCAVGEGDIPVAHCIAILKKAGYDGYLSIEYEGSEDCIEALAKGLANLKSYI